MPKGGPPSYNVKNFSFLSSHVCAAGSDDVLSSSSSSCATKREDEPSSDEVAAAPAAGGDTGGPGIEKHSHEKDPTNVTTTTIEAAAVTLQPPLSEKIVNEASKVPEQAAGDTK